MLRQILGGDIESSGRPGFVDRDIDTSHPGTIHPDVGDEIAAFVGHRNIHGLANLCRLLFRGGDDFLSVGERYHFSSRKIHLLHQISACRNATESTIISRYEIWSKYIHLDGGL